MGVLIYSLALTFLIIPLSLRAYLSLKRGNFPLPKFQNNVVVNRVKLQKAIGIFHPIIFWSFHVLFLLQTIAIEAWMSMLATITYMVVSPLLSSQIKARKLSVVEEKVVPGFSEGEQA